MKKTCYCSQELGVCVTLECLKGIQWDSDQLLNICSPFRGLGQCNKLAIDSLNKSSTYSSILLPGMAAANFKAWCTTVILEAAFLNKKKAPLAWGKYTQTHTKHRHSRGLSGCQQQLSIAYVTSKTNSGTFSHRPAWMICFSWFFQ